MFGFLEWQGHEKYWDRVLNDLQRCLICPLGSGKDPWSKYRLRFYFTRDEGTHQVHVLVLRPWTSTCIQNPFYTSWYFLMLFYLCATANTTCLVAAFGCARNSMASWESRDGKSAVPKYTFCFKPFLPVGKKNTKATPKYIGGLISLSSGCWWYLIPCW